MSKNAICLFLENSKLLSNKYFVSGVISDWYDISSIFLGIVKVFKEVNITFFKLVEVIL